jgi:hypothetical protein
MLGTQPGGLRKRGPAEIKEVRSRIALGPYRQSFGGMSAR